MKRATSIRAARTSLWLAACALLAPMAVHAGNPSSRELAQAVGMGETELRQWMGWAPLTYRQLREDPSRTSAKLRRALGPERHAQLLAGQPIHMQVEIDGHPTMVEVRRGR